MHDYLLFIALLYEQVRLGLIAEKMNPASPGLLKLKRFALLDLVVCIKAFVQHGSTAKRRPR